MKGIMPTKREVIADLLGRLHAYRQIHSEYNADAQHHVRCLEVALLCVQERKWPKGGKRT